MKKIFPMKKIFLTSCWFVGIVATSAVCISAEEFGKASEWVVDRNTETGSFVSTMELVVHPMASSQPVFKHQLFPEDFDLKEGNAAIYYIQALAFFEQTSARDRVREWELRAIDQKDNQENPVPDPHKWLSMPVSELPLKDVREFLGFLEFQVPLIERATRLRDFKFDRHIRDEDNPVLYLLPEIQVIRDLARKQSLRCRLAVAESNPSRALKIIKEQYTLANHLGDDEFLVSTLVGCAISNIATTDALLAVQMEDTPNLYWAISALPDPMITMKRAHSYERQFMFEQLKVLREVGEEPRPMYYWDGFIDRLIVQLEPLRVEGLFTDGALKDIEVLNRETMLKLVEDAYPAAKKYLVETCKLDAQQVEDYAKPQVVFLACTRFGRILCDESFKWNHIPRWQALESESFQQLETWREEQVAQLGWPGEVMNMFLVAIDASRRAQCRVEQSLSLLQTVEALRLYAADHPGKLPSSLDDLSVPAPIDCATGKPFQYHLEDGVATIESASIHNHRHVVHLKLAE